MYSGGRVWSVRSERCVFCNVHNPYMGTLRIREDVNNLYDRSKCIPEDVYNQYTVDILRMCTMLISERCVLLIMFTIRTQCTSPRMSAISASVHCVFWMKCTIRTQCTFWRYTTRTRGHCLFWRMFTICTQCRFENMCTICTQWILRILENLHNPYTVYVPEDVQNQ